MTGTTPKLDLGGRYQLERELGRGGMATVYLARDLRHDRPVAFKLLRRDVAFTLDHERFRREIATAARLQHPHICPVYDSGDTDGQLWFTMPYVRGETLRHRLRREGPLPVAEAVRLTRDCAAALAYAHEAGVIHRDVKPENILLTEDGRPLLADFGIALRLGTPSGEHLTEAGQGVGTPMYMSPEQVMGERPGPPADQYALAAVCYEMLAGRGPHAASTMSAVLAKRVTQPAPDVRTYRTEVPAHIQLALQRALALEPGDRFPSVAAFARALDRPVTAAAKHRRVPRVAWIAVAAVGLAVAVALLVGRPAVAPPLPPVAPAAAGQAPIRLAVLSFENLGDSADGYFADGMADEIRAKLSGLPGLEVIARGSSRRSAGGGGSPAAIAAELGVPYVLTGTVRWEKGPRRSRVRVSPELIEVSSGLTRWSRPFDAALTDVFGVQADIAGQVAGALHLALTDSARATLTAVPTRSLDAYARYLRSRELHAGESTPEALRGAIELLREAVALDPTFLAAWTELAQLQMDAFRQGGLRVADADAARTTLDHARALAPAAPDVLGASARYLQAVKGDFVGALRDYHEALRRAPSRSDLLVGAGSVEMELNRWSEALADLEYATRLDPRSPDAASWLGICYARLGRYREAAREIDLARSLRPASLTLAYSRARIAAAEGDLGGVRAILRQAEETAGVRALVAYVALREDLIWALEDDQLRRMTTLQPDDLDGGRGDWALAVAEAHRFLGDTAGARQYADSAVAAYDTTLRSWGNRRDRGQIEVTRALALALAGQPRDARAAADQAGRTQPPGTGLQAPYVVYVQARIAAMAGDRARGVARLRLLLGSPSPQSPGWLAIDRTLEPLRGDPAFEALLRTPPRR